MMVGRIGCGCEQGDAPHAAFEIEALGIDRTAGRFADVELHRCRTCRRLWLRYFFEHEARSRSGRWARALIEEAEAAVMTPEAAEAYLAAADWYLFGGSYFDGKSGSASGPMDWS